MAPDPIRGFLHIYRAYPWLSSASPSDPPKKLMASSSSISCGRFTTATTSRMVRIASPPPTLDNVLEVALLRIPVHTRLQSELCSTPSDLPPAGTGRPLRGLPLHPHRCVYLVLVLRQTRDTAASFAPKTASGLESN